MTPEDEPFMGLEADPHRPPLPGQPVALDDEARAFGLGDLDRPETVTPRSGVGRPVATAAGGNGGDAVIDHPRDPRVEKQDHYYRAAHTKLLDLGMVPHLLTSSVIQSILALAEKYKANVDPEAIRPTVEWRSTASDLITAGTPSTPARSEDATRSV